MGVVNAPENSRSFAYIQEYSKSREFSYVHVCSHRNITHNINQETQFSLMQLWFLS